jgi:uncharacterized protein YcbK (DUF882 family)
MVAIFLSEVRFGCKSQAAAVYARTEEPSVGSRVPPGVCLRMTKASRDCGFRPKLIKRVKKLLASVAIATALVAGVWGIAPSPTIAGGETRAISLYHIHTKESLTITYMQNGRYVPSAMKKINYLMRDWRRKETVTIDPRTVDLMWELHADLGSKAPIHIVCGYRSPRTNAFLKRVGRNVARKSQHMKGKAIDLYFPDVNTKTIRNSALVRKVGGVGYYRSSAGPTGFLHIDSGNVRHWGPKISNREMASIFSKYKKTVGARLSAKDRVMLATREAPPRPAEADKPSIYDGVQQVADEDAGEELADLSAEASKAAQTPAGQPQTAEADAQAAGEVVKGYPVPKPRPKPIEVLMMAAANMKIEPASAPPPNQVGRSKPVVASIGTILVPPGTEDHEAVASDNDGQITNRDGKGSFADSIRNGTARHTPVMKPLIASADGGTEIDWWPNRQDFDGEKALRENGALQDNNDGLMSIIRPAEANAAEPAAQADSDGKGDMLVIDRNGKGSLPEGLTMPSGG